MTSKERMMRALNREKPDRLPINSSVATLPSGTIYEDGFSAFLYSGGVMPDLNTLLPSRSCWWSQIARGINNSGQIVGERISPNGNVHAFLLTPIPEPAMLFLLGLGELFLRRKN